MKKLNEIKQENFSTGERKFRYSSEISLLVGNFRYIANFRYSSEISLDREFSLPPAAKFTVPFFCVQTTPFLVNFISTLTVIILVRLDWYFTFLLGYISHILNNL